MASGDIKSKHAEAILVSSGEAIAVGDLCHWEAGGWCKGVAGDYGKFGVALDAATGAGQSIRMGVKGRFEVKASAAVISQGAYVVAANTGLVAQAGVLDATSVLGTIAAYAVTAFASGGQGVIELIG